MRVLAHQLPGEWRPCSYIPARLVAQHRVDVLRWQAEAWPYRANTVLAEHFAGPHIADDIERAAVLQGRLLVLGRPIANLAKRSPGASALDNQIAQFFWLKRKGGVDPA